MTVRSQRGFSLVEMLVAVTILATGLLMLAGGSLFVTRDLGRGRKSTIAAGLAEAKLDQLRAAAAATVTPCTSSQFASSAAASVVNGVTMTWQVSNSGALRTIAVATSVRVGRGRYAVDTLVGQVAC